MKSRRAAELALVANTVVWGSTFILVKSALADVSTLLFLALRFSVAAAVLAVIYRRDVRRAGVWPGIAAGCLLFISYAFQTWGLELTSASKSAFITGLSIPLVPFFSSLVYKVRPRSFEVAGILIASAGLGFMTLPPGGFTMSRGDFLSFLCAVTFALHIVVISHYSQALGFETIAVVQVATAALIGIVVAPFAETVRFHLNATVAAGVLVSGLLATAFAFTVMAWAQRYTTATRSALIFTLEPVVAWTTSYVVAGETMARRGKLGAAAILAGLLLVQVTGRDETQEARETSQ